MGNTSIFAKQYAPADVWYAPVGEPFPDVDTIPAGNWATIALSTEITEDGITCGGSVDPALLFALGSVAPVKAGINRRQFQVEFETMDTSAENVALAFGGDPDDVVSTPAGGGSPAIKEIDLPASPVPKLWALLVRWNQSPEGEAFNSQLQIENAVQVGEGGFMFSKNTPNGQKYAFQALYASASWVKYVVQDSIAS